MVIYLWLVCVFCKENFLFDIAKVTNFFLGPQKFKIPYLTLVQRFIPKSTLPSTLLVYSVNPWVNHVRFYVNGLNWPQLWKRKRSPVLSPQSYRYRYPPHHRSYPIANPRSGAAAAPDSSHARRHGHEGVHGSLAATCSGAVAVQGDVDTHGAGHAATQARTGPATHV